MRNKNAKVSDPNSFVSCAGSDVHVLYSSRIMPDGSIKLTPCGKESISELINAQAKFTDISFIVNRLMAGDTSVIRNDSFYADLYEAPKSLAEAMQIQLDAERSFYNLPVDIREKFNNNYRLWIMDAGSEEWKSKMNIAANEVIEKESEVISEQEQ